MQITKSVGRLKIVIRMIDVDFIGGYFPQIIKFFTVGTSVLVALLVLGKQWIKSSKEAEVKIRESDNRLKETKEKCKAKIEIERIKAGISDAPKPYNSNLRIDKDSS